MTTSTGTLTGTVTNTEGRPLGGVYVSIPGTHQRFVITGDDGRYKIYGPPYRRYTVNCYKEGYKAVRQAVILKEGETTTVDVVLLEK